MTLNEYQEKALRTANAECRNITNGVMGLNGEAGEAIDIVKKHLFQGHELANTKLANELGDCLWYLAISAHSLGLTLNDIAEMNVTKLEARYPDGFSSEKSINRAEE